MYFCNRILYANSSTSHSLQNWAEVGEALGGIRQTLDEFHSYNLQNKKWTKKKKKKMNVSSLSWAHKFYQILYILNTDEILYVCFFSFWLNYLLPTHPFYPLVQWKFRREKTIVFCFHLHSRENTRKNVSLKHTGTVEPEKMTKTHVE